ncbi:MAG: glucose-6-phosphate isomerase [Alphaproteobacteria bacterium]|jgi:glucose-6-phosphate isomerase|nr:glucose-6-phosphate isomerase [Alphaproteobacteria bacterium]
MLSTTTFNEIQKHFSEIRSSKIVNLFDPQNGGDKRAAEFTYTLDELTLDVSKNLFTKETLNLFIKLANEMGIQKHITEMFSGGKINFTENRAVGHVALRDKNLRSFVVDGKDYANEIKQVKSKLFEFSRAFRNGKLIGYSGKPLDTVVNIGIGGSYLGSLMAVNALTDFDDKNIKVHFISNVDAANLIDIISKVDLEKTLFVVSSKTFTTQETLQNASTVRDVFLNNIKTHDNKAAIAKHFVALSSNTEEVAKFGILPDRTFNFWNFVGGRYSIWSAIGLPLLLKIGEEKFQEFFNGANIVDEHLKIAPLNKNIPFIMAAVAMWNNNLFNYRSYALIAYDYRLRDFARYLQQLEMESNGKSTNSKGNKIFYNTSPVVFGEVGTDSQHSFFQMLHQGTQIVPCDFVGFIHQSSRNPLQQHQDILFANMLAQAEALMIGKNREQVIEEFKAAGANYADYSHTVSHKIFEGNRPSTILLFNSLTPKTLGMLCALYEHKILIQGLLWNINSFDQYGVELGKKLSLDILKDLQKTPEQEQQETAEKAKDEAEKLAQEKAEKEKAPTQEKPIPTAKKIEMKMPEVKPMMSRNVAPTVSRSSSTANLMKLYKDSKRKQ